MNTEPGAPDDHVGMLRALPASEPPSALDAAILRAAREAPHVRQASPVAAPLRWRRWLDDWRAGWPIASWRERPQLSCSQCT